MDYTEIRNKWKASSISGKLTGGQKKVLRLWRVHKGKCCVCGKYVPNPLTQWWCLTDSNYPSKDHIVPKSKGGLNRPNNSRLAHRKCNTQRGSMDLTELPSKFSDKTWQELMEYEKLHAV